jgi:septum site-determining protein MinC
MGWQPAGNPSAAANSIRSKGAYQPPERSIDLAAERVVFKGGKSGLKVLLSPDGVFAEILRELEVKLSESKGFFSGAGLSVVTGRELAPVELQQLVELLCREGLKIVQITPQDVVTAEDRAKQPKEEATLLVKRTVRSGQRVSFDGNVVVLGDVNPGGEIVAAGDVIVIGTLRGTVHAGATGNAEASVTALRLMPMQLRIAHLITRAPDDKQPLPDRIETARIKGDAVIVSEYAS